MIEEIMTARTVVFGCGNTLFGDDGFGPAVARRLKEITALPQGVAVEDVGTSIGDLLFDLALSPNGPESIWIVDAVRISGRRAGEVFELDLEDIPREKRADFSMHQFPAINLLQELRDKGGVEIRILALQGEELPEEVSPGLSKAAEAAVEEAVRILRSRVLSQ
jgi:coenzyme F420 hydrogenase subunit delta